MSRYIQDAGIHGSVAPMPADGKLLAREFVRIAILATHCTARMAHTAGPRIGEPTRRPVGDIGFPGGRDAMAALPASVLVKSLAQARLGPS